MVAWRGCCSSLVRYLWSRKISQPQTPHCRFLELHKAARDGQLRGWARGWQDSGSLIVQAVYGSPALLPILHSLPDGGHQLLGLPRWNYASQKARRPPVSKSVISGNNVDKSITQRRMRFLSFLLLTHHHHHYYVQRLCCLLHPDFWVKISK